VVVVVVRPRAGTEVVEAERQGDFVDVTTGDGRTGWLERRSVFLGAAAGWVAVLLEQAGVVVVVVVRGRPARVRLAGPDW